MNQKKMHFLTNSYLHRNSLTLLCLLSIQIKQHSFLIIDSEVWSLHSLMEGYLEEQKLSIKRELCQVFSIAFPTFTFFLWLFRFLRKIYMSSIHNTDDAFVCWLGFKGCSVIERVLQLMSLFRRTGASRVG